MSTRLLLPLLSGLLLSTPAFADEDDADSSDSDTESASPDLGALLDSIPDIENPDAEAEPEEPAGPDVPLDVYTAQVRTHVLESWKPKKGAIKKNPSLETRLVLSVAPDGQVTDLKPMILSGDKKYDQSAVDAVNKAGDVPPPPKNLVSLAEDGVVVVFSGKAWLKGG